MKRIIHFFVLLTLFTIVFAQRNIDWESIGNSEENFHGNIYSLAIDDSGNIYAGGDIISIGDLSVNNIAMWDGDKWNVLSGGLSGNVQDLVFGPDNNLYACVWFANYIAKWNGQSWINVSNGMNNPVLDIAFDNNGILRSEGNRKNFELDSLWKFYNKEGKIKKEELKCL